MAQRDGVSVDVRVTETLQLEVPGVHGPERVSITVEHKSGQLARLRVRAGDNVTIKRPARKEPVHG
ncbi:hypothetical protein [Roseateles sp.]|jgi:hypothetical protein|uniref:hypothetical protein n=1 Tax=Roseateles sp. TaxID=1971397 RepID=UPI0037C9FAC4